jgi:hypothetical protein
VIDIEVEVQLRPDLEVLPLMSTKMTELDKNGELAFERINKKIRKTDKNIQECLEKIERYKGKREDYHAFQEGP